MCISALNSSIASLTPPFTMSDHSPAQLQRSLSDLSGPPPSTSSELLSPPPSISSEILDTPSEGPPRLRGSHLTIKERCEIQTLSTVSGWLQKDIAKHMGIDQTTVCRAIRKFKDHCPDAADIPGPTRPRPRRRGGRQCIIGQADRKRVVAHVTLNATNRRKKREQIAEELGIIASSRIIAQAFKEEGYRRVKAIRKPFLIETQKADQLVGAQEHIECDDEA
jgi:transposase